MTIKELNELYNKVSDAIWDYNADYHLTCTCGSDISLVDDKYISFEVYFHNDKNGHSWTEYWSIGSDGKIYTEDKTYDNFESFLSDWG